MIVYRQVRSRGVCHLLTLPDATGPKKGIHFRTYPPTRLPAHLAPPAYHPPNPNQQRNYYRIALRVRRGKHYFDSLNL